MVVPVPLGLDHVTVGDDGAVPVPGGAGELGERGRRARAVDLDAPRREVVDVEEAARHHGARAGVGVLPGPQQAAAAEHVGGGSGFVGDEHGRVGAVAPHGRRREQLRAAWNLQALDFAAEAVRAAVSAAVEGGELEHAEDPVLARYRHAVAAEQRRRARPEVGVRRVQVCLVGRGERLAQPQSRHRQLEHAVAEVGAAVPRRVTRRYEQPLTAGLDHGAAAGEDRGVARRAGGRLDQAVTVRAQRVEDRGDVPGAAVDQHDVALVGRRVAEVAAGRGEEVGAVDVQCRRELLVLGFERHPRRPSCGLRAVLDRELVDQSVRRGCVDEAPPRVCERAGGRDLGASRPARVAGRREVPERAPARCVDRERLAVGRRDHDHVVHAAACRHTVQVHGRGVDRARQADLEPAQVRNVGGVDAGAPGGDVAALWVEAELGPVADGRAGCDRLGDRRRGSRGRARVGRRRAAAGGGEQARRRRREQGAGQVGAHRHRCSAARLRPAARRRSDGCRPGAARRLRRAAHVGHPAGRRAAPLAPARSGARPEPRRLCWRRHARSRAGSTQRG